MRDTQHELGGYPGVAPVAQYGAEPTSMMRLGWSDAGVIVPWVVWKQFDDKQIIDESWVSMEKYLDHLNETKYDHNVNSDQNGNYQWGDYFRTHPMTNERISHFNEAAKNNHFNAFSPLDAELAMIKAKFSAFMLDTAKVKRLYPAGKNDAPSSYAHAVLDFRLGNVAEARKALYAVLMS